MQMLSRLKQWLSALPAAAVDGQTSPADQPATWTVGQISDEWFASHFRYAADVVHDALSPVLEPSASSLLDFGCYDASRDSA